MNATDKFVDYIFELSKSDLPQHISHKLDIVYLIILAVHMQVHQCLMEHLIYL